MLAIRLKNLAIGDLLIYAVVIQEVEKP